MISQRSSCSGLLKHGIRDLDGFAEKPVEISRRSLSQLVSDVWPELAKLSHDDAIVELLFGNKARREANADYLSESAL